MTLTAQSTTPSSSAGTSSNLPKAELNRIDEDLIAEHYREGRLSFTRHRDPPGFGAVRSPRVLLGVVDRRAITPEVDPRSLEDEVLVGQRYASDVGPGN